MSVCRRQALIDAPIESIWELVGNPNRHPEWWPRVIDVQGEQFDEGAEYVQVTKGPVGSGETKFLVERMDDLRQIKLRCQLTGTYAHWLLTDARGGTFVDLEMGMDPKAMSQKLFDVAVGRLYFRRWAEQSLDALEEAASVSSAASSGATAGSP